MSQKYTTYLKVCGLEHLNLHSMVPLGDSMINRISKQNKQAKPMCKTYKERKTHKMRWHVMVQYYSMTNVEARKNGYLLAG